MDRSTNPPAASLSRLWQAHAPLTVVGFLMMGALGLALAGVWLDPRSITGAPAWLKPAKFSVSTAIYSFTLAWVFTYLPDWPRTRRLVGWTTAAVFVLEVGIIFVQAWRGKASHFNIGTPLDAALFGIMGLAIVSQTAAGVFVAVALWRQRFEDRAMGWALRLGMTISLIGGASGGLMTTPTATQLAEARATGSISVSGAHTVGASDGGPGVPGTGWSVEHGDIRVPHFLGLHAMQGLPLLLLMIRSRTSEGAVERLTLVAAGAYVSLFVLLLWQALRGESFVHPGTATTMALSAWAVVTVAAAALAWLRASVLRTSAVAF